MKSARSIERASQNRLSAVRASIDQASAFHVVDDPGVLGAAALARIDHQRALLQRDAREAARHDPHAVRARQHERPQVHVARRNAALERRRAGRKRERRLGDVIGRIGLDLGGEFLALRGGRMRADQHAVAARAVDLLDDQLVEPLDHVFERAGSRQR